MKSSIKVDFARLDSVGAKFEPVIRVRVEDSDDVRDTLIKTFFQLLGGESSWIKVSFDNSQITLSPIKPEQLAEEAREMTERATLISKHIEK